MDSSKAYTPVHIANMQRKFPGRYVPKYRNVIIALLIKASKVLKDKPPSIPGLAYNEDARSFHSRRRARLLITSPPYLGVHSYAYDNRVRLWFLGYDYRTIVAKLFSSEILSTYLNYVGDIISSLSTSMMRNSTCVIMFGDVRKGNKVVRLGELFARYWLRNHSRVMKLSQIIVDDVRHARRRYFNLRSSEGIKRERIVILSRGNPKCYRSVFDWNMPG